MSPRKTRVVALVTCFTTHLDPSAIFKSSAPLDSILLFFIPNLSGVTELQKPLPSTWSQFNSRTLLHMWFEFVVGSRPCSEGFSPGIPAFPSLKKSNISKFQFYPESESHSFVSHNRLLRVTLVKQIYLCHIRNPCTYDCRLISFLYPMRK